MKRNNELGVGAPIFVTIVFGILAIFSYSNDGESIAWMPLVGVGVGVIMTIVEAAKASDASARKERQKNFAKTVIHDSSFGEEDLMMYFNSKSQKVTICATTNGTTQEIVDNFVKAMTIKTDNHLVVLDSTQNKIIRAKSNNGTIALSQCCINDELKSLGLEVKPSTPTLKSYNDYAFVTDDINQFVAIITPTKIHVHRYSDIVSISYEENGSRVFNKSIGGALVGGLLFGNVGAIVGGNATKATQNKEIKSMSIKILLNSTSNSTILLKIYEAEVNGTILKTKKDVDKMLYEGLMKEVNGIKDIFSIILDIVEKNITLQKADPVIQQPSNSIADELTKLAKLKETGILSEDEFQALKAKLLRQV